MMKRYLSLLAALALSAPTYAQPFVPDNAAVISDPSDLIAHCSTFAFDGRGNVYFAYYKDSDQPKEHSVNLSTFPVLAKASLAALGDISRQDIIHSGDTVGTFIHGPRAPYDPNLLVVGDTMMVYFNGCIGTEVTFCARPYDLRSETLADSVIVCRLRYALLSGETKTIPLDARGTYEFFADMGVEAEYHNDLCISSRFVPGDGCWYAALANVFTKKSKPVIVRTCDGVTFDVVMICRDFKDGACEACLEITEDGYYVAMRNSGCPREAQGTYLAKYSPEGKCLVAPKYLARCQSKPAIIRFGGSMYVFYNAYPNLNTEWGNVARSRMRVSRIDSECNIVQSWDVCSDCGIHYPYLGKYRGTLYMSFTEDRKKVDVKQCRSNVSFIKVNL